MATSRPHTAAASPPDFPIELLRQVRAAEAVDAEGRQWPRSERDGDAAAVYLVLDDATAS
jgi:hypothetical protein